ncbi:catechol 1,2-dioxygenase [Sphingomonas fennica]|uniref:catechol 1,2-dioxygenase n=1 Tax=Edaphosphingomonas fennica TaxID=114404 RepID=UPI001FE64E1E|nr:catechol 1,2-dioxygenase [Sphingomonas fennica]
MSAVTITNTAEIQALLDKVAGLDQTAGNPRIKAIVRRLVENICQAIDDFDVNESEFWLALNFLQGGAGELGLWAAGLGLEHFLDVRMDAIDVADGISGVTPRTIEGPLHVKGAPLSKREARLDDGTESGDILVMTGQVRDTEGRPVPGAIVDVWHANTLGNYSHFDPSQSTFNNRGRIETDGEGRYRFRSIVPSGYACPPGGSTERLLDQLGRHGRRPAHVHFFVTAPGFRHLTTQINIDGDPYLHDDFAYATREELIPAVTWIENPAAISAAGLDTPFKAINFDFQIAATAGEGEMASDRPRAAA